MTDDAIRQHLEAAEALAGRRATESPYMSPEERLARIEEHMGAALALLDNAIVSHGVVLLDSDGDALRTRLVPDPAPRGDAA